MTAETKAPMACIRATPGAPFTMCHRTPDKSEFVFEDGDHAVAFYKTSKVIRVCIECAEKHEKKRAAEGMGGDAAARGLPNVT
jgi:hypothetical protein